MWGLMWTVLASWPGHPGTRLRAAGRGGRHGAHFGGKGARGPDLPQTAALIRTLGRDSVGWRFGGNGTAYSAWFRD